jgi:DNA-binding response OmpR family regulator
VRQAVGDTIGERDVAVEWTEVATSEIAMDLTEAQHYDLIIGDNETTKLGGVGLTRQMRNELDWQPTVLLLLARQQDAWLAAWSGADAAVQQPVDPFALRALVTKLLGLADA